jgi:hypothetical protein
LLQIICSSIYLFFFFLFFGFREEEAQEEAWRVFDLRFGLLQQSTCGMTKDVKVVNLISTSCNLSMKEGSLFVCLFVCFVLFVLLRSIELGCIKSGSWSVWKALDEERGAWAWFHDIWTCNTKVLEYWMIFSLKIKLNHSWKFRKNWNDLDEQDLIKFIW